MEQEFIRLANKFNDRRTASRNNIMDNLGSSAYEKVGVSPYQKNNNHRRRYSFDENMLEALKR